MLTPDTAKVQNSREALLRAAEGLFCERGYSQVSTRELAEAAGVNLAAIQYHFGSKASLFVETLRRLLENNASEQLPLLPVPQNVGEAEENLRQFVGMFLAHLLCQEKPQPCRLLFRELLNQPAQDPELQEQLVSIAIKELSSPLQQNLQRTLEVLMPKAPAEKMLCTIHSILGQCTFYVTHRPLIERMHDCNFGEASSLRLISDHIVEFSLGAIRSSNVGK